MKNVIIFGIDQFGELLYYHLSKDEEYHVCAFTVDKEYCIAESFLDVPIVPFEDVTSQYPPEEFGIFICVGYRNMNEIRALKFQQAREKGYKIMSYTHKTATVLAEVFGEGNIIMEGVTIGALCKIGDGNVFWPNAHIAHHTTAGNFNFFAISVAVAGNIVIKNNCFFGNNCTIKNGIEIDSYTLVGAGAYISHNTAKYDAYASQRAVKLNKLSTEISL